MKNGFTKFFITLLVTLFAVSQVWGATLWESDLQESISGVTVTKLNNNDTWATDLNLAWAPGLTKAYSVSGSNRGVQLEFGTALSLQTGDVIRVFAGATNNTARTLSLFLNDGGSAVGTISLPNSGLRVLDYALSSNLTLNKIKITSNNNSTYIFKVVVFRGGPTTGETTISYEMTYKGLNVQGRTSNLISTISNLSSTIAETGLTTSTSNGQLCYSGEIKSVPSSENSSYYTDLQFTVADGYTFTPSSVVIKWQGKNTNHKAKASILDGTTTVTSNESSNSSTTFSGLSNAASISFASGAFTNKSFTGTVHIRVYFYGNTASTYLATALSITGTVASTTPVTNHTVTIDPNGGSYASTPDGWTYSAGVYTKEIADGTSFSAPDGLSKGTDDLSWKDGSDNDITFPVTINDDITFVAQWTPHAASTDATLSDLTVGGVTVTGFAAGTEEYNVELPFGTTVVATVAATANDANAKSVEVTQASSVTGSATVVVTAEDNTTTKTYTINFSVADSKNILLVFKTGSTACPSGSTSTQILSNNAAVSTYINQITFTNVEGSGDNGAEGSSLNVGKKAGNMFTLTAKAGYALKAMNFNAKIQDATCEFSLDGGAWTTLTSTNTSGDVCYNDIFSSADVHEFRLRSTGTSGVWIRNMQLTIIQACTPIVIAWDEEPDEFEVGKSDYSIAATANNSGVITYSSNATSIINVNASTGALTIGGLGSATLKASTPEGDGTAYCANGGSNIEISKAVNTYYLVKFDKQNETSVVEQKFYSGDAAIAEPTEPSYAGHTFQGWFDAATSGNPIVWPLTPTASRTIYAQWAADCAGPTITAAPASANYLTGRAATALSCEATAGNGGVLTYTWYSCDDDVRTNPVVLAGAPTPSTAAAGTFYFFCAVTEEGCGVVANSDVATIAVADKDPICIIKSTPTSGTTADVDGVYQGSAYFKGRASDHKLNSSLDYVGVALASGYTFQSGDEVRLNQVAAVSGSDVSKIYLYKEVPTGDNLIVTINNSAVQGDNVFAMPSEFYGGSTLYVGRKDANCNPTVGYLAVYRAMPPVLNKITVNGVEGTPDALNAIAIEVPASTTQSQLEAIAYDWISNNDAWTAAHAPVATNAWEFGVANTVTFTDKDDDASVYTITVNKAVASANVELATLTVNGNAVAVVPGQAVYNYELPYGTSAAPVVAATAEDANAEVGVITQAASATGSATFTVTAEDGTTTRDYTINFSVSTCPKFVIFDGSTMSDYEESGSDVGTGFAWTVTGGSHSEKSANTTLNGKPYTKGQNIFGSPTTSNTRYIEITIPEGYFAKFYLAGATNSSGSVRSSYISKEKTATLDESIAYASTDQYTGAYMESAFQFPGTYYYCADASIRLYELSITLYPIDYSRAVTAGRLGTICLPNGGVMVGADLFEVAYYGETSQKVFFDQIVNGEMEAGVPYVFLPQEGATQLGVYYTDAANASATHRNGLYGFIGASASEEFNIPAGEGNYIIQNNQYREVQAGADARIISNRAYLKLGDITPTAPALAPGRKRVSIAAAPSATTGIEDIEAGEAPMKVMMNGQLYILRGEKIYDATGRLIK